MMEKFTNDEGAQMAEYGMLITLIAVVVAATVLLLGGKAALLYDAAVAWF